MHESQRLDHPIIAFKKATCSILDEDLEAELDRLAAEMDTPIPARRTEPEATGSGTQVERLFDLAKRAKLIKTNTGETFIYVHDGRRTELLAIEGKKSSAANYLRLKFQEAYGRVPSGNAVSEAMDFLQAAAGQRGEQCTVHCRVARVGDEIWIDLADPAGHVILVSRDGWFTRRSDTPLFRRATGMSALPKPKRGGNINLLREFLNIEDDDSFMLLVGWLIGNLGARSCAHLLLLGEQGSAKTTTLQFLRMLIDPNAVTTRPLPKSHSDLLIAAQHSYILSFDNLSRVGGHMVDVLCRLSTGEAFSTRKLYTNSDETLVSVRRPCIFTAILDLSERADLLDRTVVVRLPRIAPCERRSEHELMQAFREKLPLILGALCTAVSHALRHLGEYKMAVKPRMLDFAEFIEAAAPALGWRQGAFTRAFVKCQEEEIIADLDSSPVCLALEKMLEQEGQIDKQPSALYDRLSKHYRPYIPGLEWPRSPEAMSREFQKLLTAFRRKGITIEWQRGEQRWIRVRWHRNPSDFD